MINEKYKTTVIIPCFNASKTIEKTLASLEKQTYKYFQVYIVNDGSTDETLSAIERYRKGSLLNITVFTKENAGVSAARNYAINRCNTELITFLDADDEYDCGFLNSMIQVLLDNDFDTVAARYEFTRNAEETFVLPSKLNYKEVSKYDLVKLYTHKRIEKINFCGFLYKKKILNQYHIRFDEKIRFGEDTLFIYQYLKYCKRGGFIDEPLYHYYINEASATHSVTYDIVQNIEAYKKVVEYWKDDPQYDQKWGAYIISRACLLYTSPSPRDRG